jgi:hypothetical protein
VGAILLPLDNKIALLFMLAGRTAFELELIPEVALLTTIPV